MKFKKRTPRQAANMNMSSTADISFLLLIFFLLTTTIFHDTGILVKLAPSCQYYHCQLNSRNVFRVLINADNEFLVKGRIENIKNLKRDAKEFILNPKNLNNLSKSPKHAVISLQSDRETSYNTYFNAYNELRAAYYEIWDEAAFEKFGFKYKHLNKEKQREIRYEYPLVIVEAEPTNFLTSAK